MREALLRFGDMHVAAPWVSDPTMAMLSKRATIHGMSHLTLSEGTTSSVGTAVRSSHQNARRRI